MVQKQIKIWKSIYGFQVYEQNLKGLILCKKIQLFIAHRDLRSEHQKCNFHQDNAGVVELGLLVVAAAAIVELGLRTVGERRPRSLRNRNNFFYTFYTRS
jgi:hypothetical protein